MEASDVTVAIDLGASSISAALVTRQGKLIRQETNTLGGYQGEVVGALIEAQIEDLIAHAALKYWQVIGIGISVPGICDQEHGTVRCPHIRGWEKFPLLQYLKDHLTRQELPVVLEAVQGCALMGEHWMGAARGTRDAVFIYAGEEIKAGILVNGTLIRGSFFMAGAIGWTGLQRNFESKFRNEGYLNYYTSVNGLVRSAESSVSKSSGRFFKKGTSAQYKPEDLFHLYEKKDPAVVDAIDQAIELWALTSANLVSLLNPEVILFGGRLFGPGKLVLERIYREAIRWANPAAMRQVKFLAGELQENAPLLGVAHMIFNLSATD